MVTPTANESNLSDGCGGNGKGSSFSFFFFFFFFFFSFYVALEWHVMQTLLLNLISKIEPHTKK